MLYTNLKIAFRNLLKFRAYSAINITGLSLGMAASVLIFMFVLHELSYDRFHQNHERIFRVMSQLKIGENVMQVNSFPLAFGEENKSRDLHIKDFVRAMQGHAKAVVINPARPTELFFEDNYLYADPSLFNVFSFELKSGNVKSVFQKPESIVLTESAARKYFGNENPVGKVLNLQNKHLFEVTGVIANPPSNSSLQFNFVLPVEAFPVMSGMDRAKWAAGGNFNLYLLADSPSSVPAIEQNINAGVEKEADGSSIKYSLESLASIHLGNNFKGDGTGRLIYIFGGVAVLILVLALFNYISLTTARATLRAREVGVRKVVGSGKSQLIQQFYTESVLLCLIAFTLALMLMQLLRMPFNELLGLQIDNSFLFSKTFLGFLAVLFVAVTLIAGGYPALILSGFSPLEMLKGRFTGNQKSVVVRKGFTVFQFAVSISLIVCSLVVKQQVSYMQTMDLGLNKDQVLVLPFSKSTVGQAVSFRDDLAKIAGVQSVSVCGQGIFRGYNISFVKNSITKKDVGLVNMSVDEHFVKTLGIHYKTSPEKGTFRNQPHLLLNEVAVKELGLEKQPPGSKIPEFGEPVAGTVKNFHFTTPEGHIKPMALVVQTDTASFGKAMGSSGIIYARLDPKADIKQRIDLIGKAFKSHYPAQPFEYEFLDEAFSNTFKAHIRTSKMLSVSTGLAIFIACLGLFGLITFATETRFKEIGIRKVLGASVASIVTMLSSDFVKLIAVSIVIALPVAWYFMEKWLQDFTYRIEIPIWIYAAASAAAVLIALLTISFQSVKAALMNPVESLRSD